MGLSFGQSHFAQHDRGTGVCGGFRASGIRDVREMLRNKVGFVESRPSTRSGQALSQRTREMVQLAKISEDSMTGRYWISTGMGSLDSAWDDRAEVDDKAEAGRVGSRAVKLISFRFNIFPPQTTNPNPKAR